MDGDVGSVEDENRSGGQFDGSRVDLGLKVEGKYWLE